MSTRRISDSTNPGLTSVTDTPVRRHLVTERLGECPHGELAHRVRRRAGRGQMTGDAADDDQPAAASLELGERGVDGAQDAEDVGLELTVVVVQRQPLHRANDAEAGVGHGHVDAAERRARRRRRRARGRRRRSRHRQSASARRPLARSRRPARSRRSVRRAASTRLAPSRAKARASAAPIPDEAPVMRTTWPVNLRGFAGRSLPRRRPRRPWPCGRRRRGRAWSWRCRGASWPRRLASWPRRSAAWSRRSTLPDSAFLMRSSACLITTGHVKAQRGGAPTTISASVRTMPKRFMLRPLPEPPRRSLGECSMGL